MEKNIDLWLEAHQDEMVTATSELIQIKSVQEKSEIGMPFGKGAFDALTYVEQLTKRLGLETVNMDGYAVHASHGPSHSHIGVLTHVDVVPEGSGWQHAPYGGTVEDGKIFGRGAIDDKGPLIASVFALAAIKASGVNLKKGVRLLFGSDEETGMVSIEHYLKHEKPFEAGFTPDARFPVIHGEKGWLNMSMHIDETTEPSLSGVTPITSDIKLISLSGGVAANVVPDNCEAILSGSVAALSYAYDRLVFFMNQSGVHLSVKQNKNHLEIGTYGKAAHASRPEKGKSAIAIMFMALSYVLPTNSRVGAFFKYYGQSVGMNYNGEGCGCAFKDEASGPLTFNIGKVKYSAGSLQMLVDVRYPVTVNETQVKNGVSEVFAEFGTEVILLDYEAPLYYEQDHALIQTLSNCYQQVSGDYENRPFVVGGLTYARTMPNIVAYGPLAPDAPDLAHQKDEYIEINTLIQASKIYAKAMIQLANQ